MPLSRKASCCVCHASSTETTKLYLCQFCRVVSYCGRDHQLAHQKEDKQACNAIQKARWQVTDKEGTLRNAPRDAFTPPNPFEERIGHFRDYMEARYALVKALLMIKTHAAAKALYEDLMDILRLNRSDNMGVRGMVPATCLRLGRDQECYDFCVWYATTGQRGDYDFRNMDLPYLDVKGADVLEPLRAGFVHRSAPLSHVVAITLLKIRLCLDLLALRNSSVLGEKVPQEILSLIQEQIISGTVLAYRIDITDRDSQASMLQTVQAQVKRLYRAVNDLNTHFWPALLNPGDNMTARPEECSQGSAAEMQMALQQSYDAWVEEPGAIDVIQKLS